MSALIDRLDEQGELDEAREALRRALRTLDSERLRKEQLVEAVYRAASDNFRTLHFEPTPKPSKDNRRASEETALICFSDLQLGQVTPTYNTEIAEERVNRYAAKIAKLTDLQRTDHPIRNARLYLIGDLIEGELIFPGQPHQIDSSLFAQVARNGPRILTNFIRTLLGAFDRVDVVSVPGNHGEVGGGSRKAYNPETNFDRMLSAFVEQLFTESGEKRVSFRVPEGYGRSSFYAVDPVGPNVGVLLWHGHQARRTSSSSHLPFYKLVLGWRGGAIPEPFNVSICGHHHTPTYLTMNGVQHFINGTFASDADYAIERLASNSRAAQWLLFAGARGITAQYLVSLDD